MESFSVNMHINLPTNMYRLHNATCVEHVRSVFIHKMSHWWLSQSLTVFFSEILSAWGFFLSSTTYINVYFITIIRPCHLHALHDMRPITTDVACNMCLSFVKVCLAHMRTVQKWLNWLRCCAAADSCGPKEPDCPREGALFRGDMCQCMATYLCACPAHAV